MIEVRQTEQFSSWLSAIKDSVTKARIIVKIDRLQLGLIGDTKPISAGLSELRLDFGPGYRLYYTLRGREIILLLIGGNKGSQNKDIRNAQQLLKELNGEKHGKG